MIGASRWAISSIIFDKPCSALMNPLMIFIKIIKLR
ncbi:mechanosensitive ion channel protein MscS [Escherichia coli]|nr:mechanosensitive ion channel protein MscS [Escherichia coli]RCZ22900.1 mechanosensitive ion channel protein MscS [Escherichia coli]RDA58303.1 mechanosensitive ion channel protein MscS [Escherichia coli]